MTVMAREKWTDERLDDLNGRMEKGFDEVKGEIRDVKGEVRELRREVNARFDSVQRTMIMGFVSISATIVGALLVIRL